FSKATQWFLIAITLILVCIRVCVRLTTVYRPWRGILVVFAWLMQLFYGVLLWFAMYRINLIGYYPDFDSLSDYQTVWIWKVNGIHCLDIFPVNFRGQMFLMEDFTHLYAINACRAVLLLTYGELCPQQESRKIYWTILFTWCLLIVHV